MEAGSTAWICRRCLKLYKEKEDAEKCACPRVSEVRVYACYNCEELHSSKLAAFECCNEVEDYAGFMCNSCEDCYRDKEGAEKCCEKIVQIMEADIKK